MSSKSAASGAPTASLVTTGSNSWVLGVRNDYDNAITRSVPTGQTLLRQDLTSSGDTYWVQMQASAIPAAGTTVAINDTAPTKDRYNLAIVEVLAGAGGTNTVSPTVSRTAPAPGCAEYAVSALVPDCDRTVRWANPRHGWTADHHAYQRRCFGDIRSSDEWLDVAYECEQSI